jgi:hypothetical protein
MQSCGLDSTASDEASVMGSCVHGKETQCFMKGGKNLD